MALVGISHGGGVSLLTAARDRRVDVLIPIFAWGDLAQALEPNAAVGVRGPGVLKLGWGSQLFAAGLGNARPRTPCGGLAADVCGAWTRAARDGSFDATARALLDERSPQRVASKLRVPTLFIQGQMDSLFDLDQVLPLARALERGSTPTRVEWLRAGHDLSPSRETQRHMDAAMRRWLDRHLRRNQTEPTGPRFTVQLGAGRGYANTPEIPPRTKDLAVPLAPDDRDRDGFIRMVTPPAGLPAAATTLPGLGDITRFADAIAPAAGQRARFTSERLTRGLEIVGAPTVRLRLRGSAPEATLFVHLVDIGARGQELIPRGLVAPIRVQGVPGLDASTATEVEVRLPQIAWRVAPGHRLAVEVASTDSSLDVGVAPATWDVALAADARLRVPLVQAPRRTAETFDAGPSSRTLLLGSAALALVALVIGLALARAATRRARRVQEPGMRLTPIVARGLAKRYGRSRPAVRSVDLDIPAGSVVGLVGPNGAGKTTILRMLLGLIHPSDGAAWIFGQRVRPGAPHLRRVGALVDGPGLLPHATMRSHLVRYARAVGRDHDAATVDAALAAVDLLDRADQPVRTGSHGMLQRVAIAQAILGDPDIVILDEPTNGLDPAQIRQLRELIRGIARDGRTVLLSSHLLGELELVCTHVVLLADGRVVGAGPVGDVVAGHGDLETAFLAAMAATDERSSDA